MSETRNPLDPSWMHLVGTFEEQVETLFKYIRWPREQAEEDRRRLDLDVENTLKPKFPDCELTLYGSLLLDTALKTSDIDYLVKISNIITKKDLCQETRDALTRRSDIFVVLTIFVPINNPVFRVFHIPTNRECDLILVSPKQHSQILSYNKLWKYFLNLDTRVIDLVILVKYWAKVHEITGLHFRDYLLSVLVMFYLQQINILPNVQSLQRNIKFSRETWNMDFEESEFVTNNKSSLKQLLTGFFCFYSAYKFEENIISVFTGHYIPKESFRCVSNIPNDFELYKEHLRKKLCKPMQLNRPMYVQDAFEHNKNIADYVLPQVFQNLKEHFKYAADLTELESAETLLKAILNKTKKCISKL